MIFKAILAERVGALVMGVGLIFPNYWTSTTDASVTTEAWTAFSCDYGVYDMPKSGIGYTLAVRDRAH